MALLGRKRKKTLYMNREAMRDELVDLFTGAVAWVRDVWAQIPITREKLKDLSGTNFKLGQRYFDAGRFDEALLRFRIGLWFEPNHAGMHFLLARCLHALDKKEAALKHYTKAIELQPQFPEAQFMQSLLHTGYPHEPTIPPAIMEEQFNRMAPHYREEYVRAMAYTGHITMEKAVTDWISHKTKQSKSTEHARFDMIEIGCGCGLTGERLRMYAKHLTGIDIAVEMLRTIPKPPEGQSAIYDKLYHEDARGFLKAQPEQTADIIFAAGVLNYYSDLSEFFDAVSPLLRPGGMFAFSLQDRAQRTEEAEQVQWLPQHGRFGHARHYVQELAKAHGLTEISISDVMLYANAPGYQCVYQKKT